MRWPVQPALTHGAALWDGLVVCFPFWPGGDVEAIGPKAGLFPTNTLAGGAVWDGNGVDTSSTTAGTRIVCGTADPIPQGSLTLMFAGRLDALPGASDFAHFVSKRDTWAIGDMRWQWFINDSVSSNYFGWTAYDSFVGFNVGPSTGYHVWLLTDDGTDSAVYEDGGLLESLVDTLVFQTDPASAVHIGNTETSNTEQFDGLIDVVAMWDRPLSAAEAAFMSAFPYALFDPRGGKLGIRR